MKSSPEANSATRYHSLRPTTMEVIVIIMILIRCDPVMGEKLQLMNYGPGPHWHWAYGWHTARTARTARTAIPIEIEAGKNSNSTIIIMIYNAKILGEGHTATGVPRGGNTTIIYRASFNSSIQK